MALLLKQNRVQKGSGAFSGNVHWNSRAALYFLLVALVSSLFVYCGRDNYTLLNVSYDPTREFFRAYNAYFTEYWRERTGQSYRILHSHGGSGKQARSVLDGLEADVVTLALAYDIDRLAASGRTDLDWQDRLPFRSSPYSSTIVFLVRAGNPKNIEDWDDLIRSDVAVITPNPKTSGGARWNYLAAWSYVIYNGGSEEEAREFTEALFRNVPVLDPGARASTGTFIRRQQGDVLLSWENEAIHIIENIGQGGYEIVNPTVSIRAEPPVAVIDSVVRRRGTEEVATAYLQGLYSEQAAQIIRDHHFRRPGGMNPGFPEIAMLDIESLGGWAEVQQKHFSEGGIFDEILENIYRSGMRRGQR